MTETLWTMGGVSLCIPAWQMILFVAMAAAFLLFGRYQLNFVMTYLFVLYWGFSLYWSEFITAAKHTPWAFTLYGVCGLALAFLVLLSFFYPAMLKRNWPPSVEQTEGENISS